jgi:hypothetical protein
LEQSSVVSFSGGLNTDSHYKLLPEGKQAMAKKPHKQLPHCLDAADMLSSDAWMKWDKKHKQSPEN